MLGFTVGLCVGNGDGMVVGDEVGEILGSVEGLVVGLKIRRVLELFSARAHMRAQKFLMRAYEFVVREYARVTIS